MEVGVGDMAKGVAVEFLHIPICPDNYKMELLKSGTVTTLPAALSTEHTPT
jgi:hypothetical protein